MSSPSNSIEPDRGFTTPPIAAASDDLPAPLAPSTVVTDPFGTSNVTPNRARATPYGDLEVAGPEQRGGLAGPGRRVDSATVLMTPPRRALSTGAPRYAAWTSGLRTISSGRPSNRTLPKSSTVTESERLVTNSTLCSTSTKAVPRSWCTRCSASLS